MVGKTEEAYNIIKSRIITLELFPGCEITSSLLDDLHLSRTPAREALQQLEREGFVIINSRKNTLVSPITRELIIDVFDVRYLVEPYIAKTFFSNIDMAELEENRKIIQSFYDNSFDRQYFIDADTKIHDMILSSCTNSFFSDLMTRVNGHSARIRKFSSMKNEEYEKSVYQHLAILDAIELGDPEAIEATVKYHVISSRRDALKYAE